MGFGRGFTFILGSLCGVYVAQHYRVPRVGDWVHSGCVKAREPEQAYCRPENFSTTEGQRAHNCWFRSRYPERNYYRPENFYGNEAGEAQELNNKAVHSNWSRPIDLVRPKTFDPNEAHEEQQQHTQYNPTTWGLERVECTQTLSLPCKGKEVVSDRCSAHGNEAHEEQYNNKVPQEDRARPMDLDGTYYRPETLDPNEVYEEQNKNKVMGPSWARPRDLNKPYRNNGPEYSNPNEASQE